MQQPQAPPQGDSCEGHSLSFLCICIYVCANNIGWCRDEEEHKQRIPFTAPSQFPSLVLTLSLSEHFLFLFNFDFIA